VCRFARGNAATRSFVVKRTVVGMAAASVTRKIFFRYERSSRDAGVLGAECREQARRRNSYQQTTVTPSVEKNE